MADFPDVPAGYGIPLVDLATDLLPAPTMDAVYDATAAYVGARFSQSATAPTDPEVIWLAPMDDSEPPTAPSNLAATPVSGAIDLAWVASVDNSGAIGEYRVYRDAVLIAAGVTTLSYSDTSALWDTEYDYTVTARDVVGNESDPSNTATATRGLAGAPAIAQENLIAHYRASDLILDHADGSTVTILENRLSDGADLVMFGTPSFETSGIRPSIVFDGVNHAANAATGIFPQPTTRIIVFKMRAIANSKPIISTRTAGSNRQAFTISTDSTGYNFYAGSTRVIAVAPNLDVHVAGIRAQGATTRVNIDGVIYTISSPGTEGTDGIRIASDTSGAIRTNMEMFEVIQYAAALSDAELDGIVTSLKSWYGIA